MREFKGTAVTALLSLGLVFGSARTHADSSVDIRTSAVAIFGSLIVNGPRGDFTGFKVEVFKPGSPRRFEVTKSGHAYHSHPGEVCLAVSDLSATFSYTRCGFKVVARQTLTINLGRVTFRWDAAAAKADLPPRPSGAFLDDNNAGSIAPSPATAPAYVGGTFFLDAPSKTPLVHLLPVGNYLFKYRGASSLENETRKFSVTAAESSTVDLTPPDKRVEVRIHVPQLKYDVPILQKWIGSPPIYVSDYIRVVRRSAPVDNYRRNYPTYSMGLSSGYYIGLNAGEAYDVRVPPVRDFDVTLHLYPLSKTEQTVYELIVNEIVMPLDLTSGHPLKISLGGVNVKPLAGNDSGVYRVLALPPGAKTEAEGLWLGWIKPDNGTSYGYSQLMGADVQLGRDPVFGQALDGNLFPAGTSLHLAPGWKYVVKVFSTDDLNMLAEVGRQEIDLTPKAKP